MSFSRVHIGNVAEFINGFPFKPDDWEESGRRIIRIQNLTDPNKPFNRTTKKVPQKYQVIPGELLVSWSATLGVFVWEGPDTALVNQHIFRVVPDSKKVHLNYFRHILEDALFEMNRHLHGATMKHVNRKEFLATTIPLPSLSEQKRIAGILDTADALRAKRRESLSLLDNLIQSTFLDLFGDPVTNPMGWKRRTLGEITAIKAPMVNPGKKEYRNLLHYGPDRIEKDTGELLPALTAEEDGLISGKFLCSPGEILYSKIRPYLNKVALVQERCLCSADVYPVRSDNKMLTKEYLVILLRSAAFLDYVAGFSRRANIPKINRKQFAAYNAPLPPLDLQQRFATIVESMERQKARLRSHLAEIDTLFASLQQRAFNGEL